MNKFIEKILEKLEALKQIERDRPDECDENGDGDGEQIYDDGRSQGRYEQTVEILKIIREEAKAYAKDTNVTTNADHIRAMSDEELAEFISEQAGFSTRHWLKWLKSEVEE